MISPNADTLLHIPTTTVKPSRNFLRKCNNASFFYYKYVSISFRSQYFLSSAKETTITSFASHSPLPSTSMLTYSSFNVCFLNLRGIDPRRLKRHVIGPKPISTASQYLIPSTPKATFFRLLFCPFATFIRSLFPLTLFFASYHFGWHRLSQARLFRLRHCQRLEAGCLLSLQNKGAW